VNLHGVDLTPVIEESPNIAATIHRVAREQRCDLIVMGTRGRSAAASVLLGSETEQTMVETQIPLLVVKQRGARLRLLPALLDDRFRRRGDLHFG
jgi:nucleotide-binding universal stress UspA family protein